MVRCPVLLFLLLLTITNINGDKTPKEKKKQVYGLYRRVQPTEARKPTAAIEPSNISPEVYKQIQDYASYSNNHTWSIFPKKNMEEAVFLIKQLIAIQEFEDFIVLAKYLRKTFKWAIYYFVYTAALLIRNDTQDIRIPPAEQFNPNWYISKEEIKKATNTQTSSEDKHKPVVIDYKYENSDDSNEGLLAYFREDIFIVTHHWTWHLVYIVTAIQMGIGERRGEIFAFSHHEILARYDAERISCKLPRVRSYNNFREPIPESYHPTNLASVSEASYPGRDKNLKLADVPEFDATVDYQEECYNRLVNASLARQAVDKDGLLVDLVSRDGLNILSNLAESNIQSINPLYYGNFHNDIHGMLGRITNADEINVLAGVIAYAETSLRDPLFYPLHKGIDNIFYNYQSACEAYTEEDLLLPNLEIRNIYVIGNSTSTRNTLETYTQERYVNLTPGLDFSSKPVLLRTKHLDHEQFTHNIIIDNKQNTSCNVTVRIFIAPKQDHLNEDIPFSEQIRMFFTLDIFSYKLEPGEQTIIRQSQDSSVTVPTQPTLEQLETTFPVVDSNVSNELQTRCLCGWPDSHLIPRGTPEGMPFTYFVMLSPGEDYHEPASPHCTSAPVYCSVWNSPYPDDKNMGYPFDLPAKSKTVADFAGPYPNMKVSDITIKHSSTVLRAPPYFT